jgi:hypothetical protein
MVSRLQTRLSHWVFSLFFKIVTLCNPGWSQAYDTSASMPGHSFYVAYLHTEVFFFFVFQKAYDTF